MTLRPPRILVVDDDPQVLATYRSILMPAIPDNGFQAVRAAFFDEAPAAPMFTPELTLVDQGEAAIEAVAMATATGGFAMAFVDMRMPPGIDGLATVERLWALDADLQVVIASAYSDMPWSEITRRLGSTDRLLFLKKPFDAIEASQLAMALCCKRRLLRESRERERQLAEHVTARTLDLAKALRSAEREANARMQFVANMSHEIRTPLTAILGFTEMLREPDCDAAERAEHLAIIERNSQHLLQLVNGVLDLSKLEADQLLLEAKPIDLQALLGEVVSSVRSQVFAKGLEVAIDYAESCPRMLRTDGLRVRQILINLLGNALKFTAAGKIAIRAVMTASEAGPQVSIAVVDTGIGIPRERLAALFQPFVQAELSTSRRFGGTGLGLSISRQLARLLGGSLTVDSELGVGSTFTLSLPIGDAVSAAAELPLTAPADGNAQPGDQPGPEARPRLSGRFLLVDDGVDNRRLLGSILSRAGAEVTLACNGVEAVAAVALAEADQRPFAMILMDMHMPVMDGYAATRSLRAAGCTRPIVALTANALEGDRERCLAEGCDSYETKPVRAARLVATCAALMAAGPQAAGPDDAASKR